MVQSQIISQLTKKLGKTTTGFSLEESRAAVKFILDTISDSLS